MRPLPVRSSIKCEVETHLCEDGSVQRGDQLMGTIQVYLKTYLNYLILTQYVSDKEKNCVTYNNNDKKLYYHW